MNFALKPSFWIIRAYFRDARRESSSDLAPVTTILPDAKIKAVVFGSRILIITAAKRWRLVQSTREMRETIYLGVVFGISRMQRNRLQIKTTIKIDCRNDISEASLARLPQKKTERELTVAWAQCRTHRQ